MTEVIVKSETVEPSLIEQAKAAGIDVGKIDPTRNDQQADPKPPPKADDEDESVKDDDAADEADEDLDDEDDGSDDDADDTDEELAKKAADKAGIDLKEVTERYYANGEKLSEDDYKALEKANYPRNLVDQFIEGRKAIVEAQRQTVFATVGGEGRYNNIIKWAADNLSDKEIEAYNKAVNSNNMEDVLMAVKGLKARYSENRSVPPQRKVAGKSTAPKQSVYTNITDLKADMSNPRYASDPAFRAKVEQKLARSSIL
jgi:hypothetical protein